MKKNFKKISALALILVLALGIFASCGSSSDSEEDKTIKVAATPAPHAEILNDVVKDLLAEDGWTLEVVEFDDYVQPNEAVSSGDVDANYFQHQPYLDQYNDENGTDIVSVGVVHYEPLGVYKAKKSSFDELEDGDTIAIPNDVTNEARALQLLAANNIITLEDGVGLEATPNDIVENPLNLNFTELAADTVASALPDVELAVINGNYALGAGLTADDAIVFESSDSEAAEEYANVIAVAAGNEDTDKTKALVAALQSDEVKQYIEDTYEGSVQAAF